MALAARSPSGARRLHRGARRRPAPATGAVRLRLAEDPAADVRLPQPLLNLLHALRQPVGELLELLGDRRRQQHAEQHEEPDPPEHDGRQRRAVGMPVLPASQDAMPRNMTATRIAANASSRTYSEYHRNIATAIMPSVIATAMTTMPGERSPLGGGVGGMLFVGVSLGLGHRAGDARRAPEF